MAAQSLTTGTNSGTQTTTQSPQASAAPSGFGGAQTSSVQPGTTSSLLDGTGGIPLGTSTLSTVSLGGTAATSSTTASSTPVTHHKVNLGLMAVAVLFFVVALALFVSISRSAKNTTD